MKHSAALVITAFLLFSGCSSREDTVTIGKIEDCGEGTYSMATNDKNYSAVRDCLLTQWDNCSSAVGSLTMYTVEGDPVTDTYSIEKNDAGCVATVVHDQTQDRYSDQQIHASKCAGLARSTDTFPLLTSSDCSSQ